MRKRLLAILLPLLFLPTLALAQASGSTASDPLVPPPTNTGGSSTTHSSSPNSSTTTGNGTATPAVTATPPPTSTSACDGSFTVTDLFAADGLLPPFLRTADAAQSAGFDCLTAGIQYYTSLLLFVIGVAAFFYMIYGAFLYMTAFGEDAKAQQAKKIITQALVGLVIASLAYTIIIILNTTLSGPALHLTN